MARELSQRTYPQLNCLDPHHAMSHHRNEPALIAGNARVQTYHYSLFAKFVERLKNTPDGDGSLLDHSLILAENHVLEFLQHRVRLFQIVIARDQAVALATIRGGSSRSR